MPLDRDQVVSADVVMRPAGGHRLPANAVITVDTLATVAPATGDVTAARLWFERAGFRPGALAGISFSIEGAIGLFEDRFRTQLVETANGGLARVDPDDATGTSLELSLDALPTSLSTTLEAVTFPEAPDYGPGSF